MGTYLSTPVTDKCEESGEALTCPAAPLVWGVVDMQGWRKSMEDSHVAQTDVEVPPHLQTDQDHDAKVFGVFDGHGGAEVARFTQLYLVDVLTKQATWVKEPETEEHVVSPVGQALVDTFHALDRMIDQPERRDELIHLRTNKPKPGERKTVGDIGIPPEKIHHTLVDVVKIGDTVGDSMATVAENEEQGDSIEMNEISSSSKKDKESVDDSKPAAVEESKGESPVDDEKEEVETKNGSAGGEPEATAAASEKEKPEATDATSVEEEKQETTAVETTSVVPDATNGAEEGVLAETTDSAKAGAADTAASPDEPEAAEASKEQVDEAPALKEEPETKESGGSKIANGTAQQDDSTKEDDDSDAAVGKEEAAKLDQDLLAEEPDNKDESSEVTNRKVTAMFQKLLSLGGNTGQVSVNISDEDVAEQQDAASTAETSSQHIVPTIIQNGRQICNLPDHAIHAGCTAIVAVLIGRKLTIANAGDSRAVLCRAGGRTEALSFDHKPQQDRELTRIRNAGGFVNQFGRVNGNLNLSRSIGDLKYKQVPGIGPESQMITAEPDIVEVYLQSNDEFFILGCDGIWDCLTNIQAVKYVRERIDTMSPTEIGAQMLDEIISDDPRATQGIGGDNMTVMVIDLQPGKRSYRNKSTGNE